MCHVSVRGASQTLTGALITAPARQCHRALDSIGLPRLLPGTQPMSVDATCEGAHERVCSWLASLGVLTQSCLHAADGDSVSSFAKAEESSAVHENPPPLWVTDLMNEINS